MLEFGGIEGRKGGEMREERLEGLLEEDIRTEIDEQDKGGDFTDEWEVDG